METQGTDLGKTTPILRQPVAVCPKIVSRRVNRPIVLTNLVAVLTNLVAAFTNLAVILTNPAAVFPKIVTILTQMGTI